MISNRQRRNLSKFSDMELNTYIYDTEEYLNVLRQERNLRISGSRPYNERGKRIK